MAKMSNGTVEGKIVILGSQGVGKTSLVSKYLLNNYSEKIPPTIGASFRTCNINLDGCRVRLQIWDTAGQERFKCHAPLYYRNANGAILVFDITNYKSFLDMKMWVHELQMNVQETLTLTLVGNKIDLEDVRAVSREEAAAYANSLNAPYFETSVIENNNIESIFIATAVGICRQSGQNLAGGGDTDQALDGEDVDDAVGHQKLATGFGRVESGIWQRENYASMDR